MLWITIISALILGLNPEIRGTALAAEKTHSPSCRLLASLRAEFDTKTRFTALTPGQFHFVEGIYVGSPSTPEGLPPGDGALLATHSGANDGIVIWTRGPLACAPIPIIKKPKKLIARIKTGTVDGEGDEPCSAGRDANLSAATCDPELGYGLSGCRHNLDWRDARKSRRP